MPDALPPAGQPVPIEQTPHFDQMSLQERLALVRSSAPPPPPRKNFFDRVRGWAVWIFLATLPLSFIDVPRIPFNIFVTQMTALFVAGASVLAPSFWAQLRSSKAAVFAFVAGNVGYLTFLGVVSGVRNDETPPMFFFSKIPVLFGVLCTVLWFRQAEQRASFYKFMNSAAAFGLVLTGGLFAVGLSNSGSSPATFAQTMASGNARATLQSTQFALRWFNHGTEREKGEVIPVYKNVVAEGLAVLGLLVMLVSRLKNAASIALFSAIMLAIVATLSRSSILMFVISAGFIFLTFSGRRVMNATVVLSIGLAALTALLLLPSDAESNVLADRFQADKSTDARVEQFTQYLGVSRSAEEILIGSGANKSVDGNRIHNLLFSSYIEGGLIAFAFIAIQYAAVAFRGLVCLRFGLAAFGVFGLCIGGVARTFVSGAGGYYTVPGLFVVLLFLVLSDPAVLKRQREQRLAGTL